MSSATLEEFGIFRWPSKESGGVDSFRVGCCYDGRESDSEDMTMARSFDPVAYTMQCRPGTRCSFPDGWVCHYFWSGRLCSRGAGEGKAYEVAS